METKTWQERTVEATRSYNRFIQYEDTVNRGLKPAIESTLFRCIRDFLRHTGNQCYGYEYDGRVATIRGYIKGQPFIVDLTKEFTEPEAREGVKYAVVQTVEQFMDFYDTFKPMNDER